MPRIRFVKENVEIEVPQGANLRKEALKAGVSVYKGFINGAGEWLNRQPFGHCPGMGMCGTCRVKIVKGIENTNRMGPMEKFKFHSPLPDPIACFAYIGNEDTMRLACKTTVQGDIEVETGPEVNLFGENFFS